MASFEQVVKFENEKPNGVVRLVEANGFYRAYNHSAYLFHQVIAQHKVTRKFVKNINQQLVYIGFPVDKLLERIGTRSHKKTEFGYDVELAADELPSDKLLERRYVARPSRCFIIHDPKMREVFAAEFRDRVVHHLFYNYLKPYRTYPSTRSLRRMRGRMKSLDWSERPDRVQARVNSMLGFLSHYDCYQIRKVLVYQGRLRDFGEVSEDCLRFYPDMLTFKKNQARKLGGVL